MGVNENLRKDGTGSDNHSDCTMCQRSVEDQQLIRMVDDLLCRECAAEVYCQCGDPYSAHADGGHCEAIYLDERCGCPKFVPDLPEHSSFQEASKDAWSGGFAENH